MQERGVRLVVPLTCCRTNGAQTRGAGSEGGLEELNSEGTGFSIVLRCLHLLKVEGVSALAVCGLLTLSEGGASGIFDGRRLM